MMALRSLRFASFTLDLDRLSLSGPSGLVELRPKSFDVLSYLLHQAGRVVDKEEVITAVWPGVTVTEESLTQCISEVRRALGNESQRIIKTVPKRGYLFDVPVSACDLTVPPPAVEAVRSPDHLREPEAETPFDEEKWNALLRYQGKPFDEEKWNALLRYDEAITTAAAKVRPLGDKWIDELARAYLMLEDKQYLPNILQNIISDAKQEEGGGQSEPEPERFQTIDQAHGILFSSRPWVSSWAIWLCVTMVVVALLAFAVAKPHERFWQRQDMTLNSSPVDVQGQGQQTLPAPQTAAEKRLP